MPKGNPGSMRNLMLYIGKGYEMPTASQLAQIVDSDGMFCNDITIVIGNEQFDYNNSTQQSNLITSSVKTIKEFWKVLSASGAKGGNSWISLPAMDISSQAALDNAHRMIGAYKNFIDAMRDAINSVKDEYEFINHVRGFYFKNEAVHPVSKKISPTNPTATSSVKLMSDISDYIRSMDKEFLWCPYYGYDDNKVNITYNLGVIANRTNIFDHILIQPAYYKEYTKCDERNITAVRNSLSIKRQTDGAVVDLQNVPIAGGRSSNAKAYIGAVMEMDTNIISSSSAAQRYQLYVNAFKSTADKAQLTFYAGQLSTILGSTTLINKITEIYNQ